MHTDCPARSTLNKRSLQQRTCLYSYLILLLVTPTQKMTPFTTKLLLALLPLLLLWIQFLPPVSGAKPLPFNGFANDSSIPKPTNITCYVCADRLAKEAQEEGFSAPPCDGFRQLWRQFVKAKTDGGVKKSNYRDEILQQMMDQFGQQCPYGTEDCYFTRAHDVRIVGYEARGCGSGPPEVDAEPGEGCAQEQMTFAGDVVDIINCVCEEGKSTSKGYCNKGVKLGGRGPTFGGILTALVLIMRPALP